MKGTAPQRQQRRGVPAWDGVLGLVLAAARREAHAEMGKAIGPSAGHAQLRRAVDRVELQDRVPVHGCGDRAEEVATDLLGCVGHPALHPHLVDRVAPAGEHAHAVARGRSRRTASAAALGEILEDALAHLVGGFDVQGDAGDRAQRAQPDDEAVEVGVASGGAEELADEVTISSPATAVARLPLASPEPWVAVATAPATEMWGSDARLARASPSACSASASSPYRSPAEKDTVPASWSTAMSVGRPSRLSSSAESAMPVNECREPRTRTLEALATSSRTCSRVDGRCTWWPGSGSSRPS